MDSGELVVRLKDVEEQVIPQKLGLSDIVLAKSAVSRCVPLDLTFDPLDWPVPLVLIFNRVPLFLFSSSFPLSRWKKATLEKKSKKAHNFASSVNRGERTAAFPPGRVVHIEVAQKAKSL